MAQIRTKHRNLQQAILSGSAHPLFVVYARSMQARPCPLWPRSLGRSPGNPDLLPLGFAWLRHLGRWSAASALFLVGAEDRRRAARLTVGLPAKRADQRAQANGASQTSV